MTIPEKLREVLRNKGQTQTWVVSRMNAMDPDIHMSLQKLSATLNGRRTLSAEEFIAFCKATNTSPNAFWRLDTVC